MKWSTIVDILAWTKPVLITAIVCTSVLLGIDLAGVWAAKLINGICW